MNKLKTILYVTIVLWIAVLVQMGVHRFFQDDHRMIEAIAHTHSDALESKLQLTANYGKRYLTTADKKGLIRYLAEGISVQIEEPIEQKKEGKISYFEWEKNSANGVIKIDLVTISQKQYILADICLYRANREILLYKQKWEELIRKLGIKQVQCTVQWEGTYKGKLSIARENRISDTFLRELQASVVEEHRKKELFFVYGYSELLPEYTVIDRKKMNITVTFHYDMKKNKTHFCVASPMQPEETIL